MPSAETLRVLICGGGNAAHVYAAYSSLHYDTRVFDLSAHKPQQWTDAMAVSGLTVSEHTASVSRETKAKPFVVSNNPGDIVTGSDVIIFAVPAVVHDKYLKEIKPYLSDGVCIVGFPGLAGFQFGVKAVLGEIKYNLLMFETLPWNCRIKTYGTEVDVLGTKDAIFGVARLKWKLKPHVNAVQMLQTIMGERPKLNVSETSHPIGVNLMSPNAYLHTSIMYNTWKCWDGQPLDKAPIFYQNIDEKGAQLLSSMSDEVVSIATKIQEVKPDVDVCHVQHLTRWFPECYLGCIDDTSSLLASIRTNHAFDGLAHPMTQCDGGLVPDFKHRYLTEDIPMGLVVLRSIAHILQVPTPNIDTVLMWAQKQMGKEYLVNGQLTGSDMTHTRAPQKYNLRTVDDILSC